MAAYYNEIDPYAAQWLRNLIAAGHIADGVVDNRSISDVTPNDLKPFTQCHFFAGIGVWSHALRSAGWDDSRPVWTGSCPCQPFSVAGANAGMDDERHLWPHWHWLIQQCRPAVVFGEQVEAAIKHGWLDLVQSDLEGIGYAFAAAGIPAAGVGAPHIRQRLWFVADTPSGGWGEEQQDGRGRDAGDGARKAFVRARGGATGGLDHHHHQGLEGFGRGHQAASGRDGTVRPIAASGKSGWLADTVGSGQSGQGRGSKEQGQRTAECGLQTDPRPTSPTNGHWRAADWLLCRDGKWRTVEPGTFPLAHGATGRVGRLRAYGNAIVSQVAQELIAAYMECRP